MTALLAPFERGARPADQKRQLRALPRVHNRLASVPYLITVAVMVALGMAGVLVLNVTIQQRAATLHALQTQDTNLGYQQAALQTQVDQLSSTSGLMRQAYAAGMRPNPKPAFIQLPEGTIVGKPAPVLGNEMADQAPQAVYSGATASASPSPAAAGATAKPTASGSVKASAKPSAAASSKPSAKATTKPSAKASSKPSAKASAAASAGGR